MQIIRLAYFYCCVDGQNTTDHDTHQNANSKGNSLILL
jgi:hypothetical protein